jgi:hypothetical protein
MFISQPKKAKNLAIIVTVKLDTKMKYKSEKYGEMRESSLNTAVSPTHHVMKLACSRDL